MSERVNYVEMLNELSHVRCGWLTSCKEIIIHTCVSVRVFAMQVVRCAIAVCTMYFYIHEMSSMIL